MSRKLTSEEMEQHHIYDDDRIWEKAQDSTDICLEDFAKMAQIIKDGLAGSEYVYTYEGVQVMFFKLFFDMGVWYGLQEYRNDIVRMMNCELEEKGEQEIEEIPNATYQLIDASVDAYAMGLCEAPEIADEICSGWSFNVMVDENDEDIE